MIFFDGFFPWFYLRWRQWSKCDFHFYWNWSFNNWCVVASNSLAFGRIFSFPLLLLSPLLLLLLLLMMTDDSKSHISFIVLTNDIFGLVVSWLPLLFAYHSLKVETKNHRREKNKSPFMRIHTLREHVSYVNCDLSDFIRKFEA